MIEKLGKFFITKMELRELIKKKLHAVWFAGLSRLLNLIKKISYELCQT